MVNVNLGAPYESIIIRIMKAGYASSQVEVLRQALLNYQEKVGELEEAELVHRAVVKEMDGVRKGRVKTVPAGRVFREAGL